MENPLNFFLTPMQQAEVREDQYWHSVPSGGADWTSYGLDYRGNATSMQAMDGQITVKVTADDDGNLKDSNDFYKVRRFDQWFGVGGGDLGCNMRLQSSDDLEDGDACLAIIAGVVQGSPDPADDGAVLVVPILTVPNDKDHFWAEIIGVSRKCDGGFAYRWKPATPKPCCEWDNTADEGSTPGCEMEVTVIAEGDSDHTPAQWEISFINGPPTFGVFLLRLDSTDYGPFQYNVSAADLQAALPDVAVSLTDFVYSITADDYDPHAISIPFINLEPASQNLACEINNQSLGPPFQVMLWKGQGGDAKISIEKTDAEPMASVPTGVSWVVTLVNTIAGSFTLKMDEFDPTDDTRWDCAASTLETNINEKISPATVTVTAADDGGPFTITVTSDYLDHDIVADDDGLFGDRTYLFWPDTGSGSGPPTDDWTPIFINEDSSPFLASNKQLVLCETFVGSLTVLLPTDAGTGTQIRVAVYDPDLGGGDVTVDPGVLNIQGVNTPFTMPRYIVKEFVMGNPAPSAGNWLICG